MRQRRFVVLDRDGTLIVEHHYPPDPAQVELLTGASGALRLLRECGLGPGALHRSGQKMPLPAVSSIDTLT